MKHMVVLLFVLSLLFPSAVRARVNQDPEDNAPVEFILRPVREGFGVEPRDYKRGSEVNFRKEPDYASGFVFRQALRISDDPSDIMGFAYDGIAQVIYFDWNRNLDLTDDGPAIAADYSPAPGRGRFHDVPLVLEHAGIPVPYNLDISFYHSRVIVTVKSGWTGDVEIGGTRCWMGIADDLDGVFSSRDAFWLDHERNRRARLPQGERDDLELPDWIYFEGTTYRFVRELRESQGEVVLAVALIPLTEDLMEISFEGRFVSRVILTEDGGACGMLDWPAAAMRIPQGIYYPIRVDLLDSFYGSVRRWQKLEPGGNTLLKVGGPVHQEVSIERSGTFLSLSYALRGADDNEYAPDRSLLSGESDPRFAIYRGGLRVGTGPFEYG